MRVAPVGLLPSFFDAERAVELGAKLAALTHGHATGYLSAGALAAMIRTLADGAGYEAAALEALQILSGNPVGAETTRSIERALEMAREPAADPTDDIARLGEGWIAEEALAIGLYAAMRANDFQRGDSDRGQPRRRFGFHGQHRWTDPRSGKRPGWHPQRVGSPPRRVGSAAHAVGGHGGALLPMNRCSASTRRTERRRASQANGCRKPGLESLSGGASDSGRDQRFAHRRLFAPHSVTWLDTALGPVSPSSAKSTGPPCGAFSMRSTGSPRPRSTSS